MLFRSDFVKSFLSEIPSAWDETKFLAGYPGKEVVLARRSGDKWYIAGINGENREKELTFDLSPLSASGTLTLIGDGATMQDFIQTETQPSEGECKQIKINTLPYGGFVAVMPL